MKISNIAFSTDGKTITFFDEDGSFRVFESDGDCETGRFYDPISHAITGVCIALMALSDRVAKLESPAHQVRSNPPDDRANDGPDRRKHE